MRLGLILVGGLLVLAGGLAGYLIGAGQAPDQAEADAASAEAREVAFDDARELAYSRSLKRGRAEGLRTGALRGDQLGAGQGLTRGSEHADAELVRIEEAEAAAAAAAEAAERAANCGAPLFVEGYCPTDEEIAQESAAESLCGPGTAEGAAEAARLGITC